MNVEEGVLNGTGTNFSRTGDHKVDPPLALVYIHLNKFRTPSEVLILLP